MFLRIGVSAVGRNQVNYPAERADGTDPGCACHDQPDQTDNNSSVVNLSESGNQKTQQPCYKRIAHFLLNTSVSLLYEKANVIVQNKVGSS